MQQSLFNLPQPAEQIVVPLQQGTAWYVSNWLANSAADTYFEQLRRELKWRQDTIKLYGRSVKIPRLQAWYGDPHCYYRYSGLALAPQPWTSALTELKIRCEQATENRFNSVLANLYRNGNDGMGMHADDEPELGKRPTIASITLGAERAFVLKHKLSGEKHRLVLEHGSLLVMAGNTQRYYQHGLAKTTRKLDARINLTYRYIYPL